MFASRIVFSDPDKLADGLPLLRDIALGLIELAKVIDLDLSVHLSIDRSILTADTRII